MVLSTVILQPSLSQILSLYNHLSLAQADLAFDHSVFWQSLAVVALVSVAD